jgi:hypothetical protein
MTTVPVIGLKPWLPWPLGRWAWLTRPVRAERLAALRIGLSLVLLVDVLTTYLPHAHDFFGRDSLGSPGLFPVFPHGKPLPGTWHLADWFGWWLDQTNCNWSVLQGVEDPGLIGAAMVVWALATAGLLVGAATRLNAVVVWLLSTSFASLNTNIDNGGDVVRGIVLFYLMLCPCGAAWSVDAWLWRRRHPNLGPVFVYPWALRLLFVQMIFIYWCNGVEKFAGVDWREGNSLYYVLSDLTLARWSYAQVQVPWGLTRGLSWIVLTWELLFPLFMVWRWSRIVALWMGALFHLGIWVNLELGFFGPYMLCLYLPLIPWECCRLRRGGTNATPQAAISG